MRGGRTLLPLMVLPVIVSVLATDGVVSYTRFSSANQDERTSSDQQRVCRGRAASDGYEVQPLLEFSDEAVSGAKHSRQGFDLMLDVASQMA